MSSMPPPVPQTASATSYDSGSSADGSPPSAYKTAGWLTIVYGALILLAGVIGTYMVSTARGIPEDRRTLAVAVSSIPILFGIGLMVAATFVSKGSRPGAIVAASLLGLHLLMHLINLANILNATLFDNRSPAEQAAMPARSVNYIGLVFLVVFLILCAVSLFANIRAARVRSRL